jgi:hypothetical protein
MRYYFHLVNGRDEIPDDTGLELLNFETVEVQALSAISELRQEVGMAAEDWTEWRMDIVSPEGRLLHSIPLAAVSH